MEQISLEYKVSNTLKWLANQIACIVLYIAFMGGVIGYLIGKYWKKK